MVNLAESSLLHFHITLVHAFPKWEAMVKRMKVERNWFGRIPMTVVQIYRIVGYFGFGAVATLLTTEVAKYQVE